MPSLIQLIWHFRTAQLGVLAIVSVLLPHAGVAQLRETHRDIFAPTFENHLRLTSAHAEVVVDCQRFQDPILSVLHQLASHNEHIREEEDTNGEVFLHTRGRAPCQDQSVWVGVLG